ncbi:MAG: acyl-CoA dehydrogenase [Propionibacteriales bacterium]|nr:acyl-CoA dehydrogenase [Propionibacteriales bacterium]
MASSADETRSLIETVREFVKQEVLPVANALEHEDEYPQEILDKMAELGFFGLTIPVEYGGVGLSKVAYASVVEELCTGWMSLAGAINSHLIVGEILYRFGTEEQRKQFLPSMAAGEVRGALGLSEAEAGSDVASLRTRAVRSNDGYALTGSKLWVTNGRRCRVLLVAAKTDPQAEPAHKGISLFVALPGAGYSVARDHEKLGYKGVETSEVVLDSHYVDAGALVGGEEGAGFAQVMAGLELGRLNVAARAVGVARAAYEAAFEYAQERETFGKPIAQHQTIQNMLADMAINLKAARLLTRDAAEALDRGERADLEAGMAKLFASETAAENSLSAMRIHGGFGFTKDFPVERYYRDAPLMLIGEGTNEIQRLVVASKLLKGQQP